MIGLIIGLGKPARSNDDHKAFSKRKTAATPRPRLCPIRIAALPGTLTVLIATS
nr:hypothetical protein [Pseudomonas syringae pv. actinidiae]